MAKIVLAKTVLAKNGIGKKRYWQNSATVTSLFKPYQASLLC
ncbi:hypothetical protein [Xenorhabdus anantnagensis]|uniref:Uncharacterized protein n=1 Tax=Xenorhabdus anantnagensis TaxID=3025875 RepID=A0ABT5LTV7_9GAMM|nr:hypothetical protein [Xenorhabdus anantnagensis]MDC9597851.1 hypothetical protein [Xenorhabdus anantnagensis]